MKTKLKVGKDKRKQFTKTKRVSAKIPKDLWKKIGPLKKKYNIKSNQAIFDYLVVSGVIYFDRPIIELIDSELGFFIERNTQMQLSKLGKCDPPEMPETHFTNFLLYPKDLKALNDFCIEKNSAKQWIFEILFRAFVEEREEVISLILKNQGLKVRERKKQIARLAEDKWVKILPADDQKAILDKLTRSYEERSFDTSLQSEIDEIIRKKAQEMSEERILEEELNKKIQSMRLERTNEMNRLAAPREENG